MKFGVNRLVGGRQGLVGVLDGIQSVTMETGVLGMLKIGSLPVFQLCAEQVQMHVGVLGGMEGA